MLSKVFTRMLGIPVIDVLNKDGDIIQDFAVTAAGFAYLQRALKFKVASEDPD